MSRESRRGLVWGTLMIVIGGLLLTGLFGPNGWRQWSVVLGVMAAGASAFYLLDVSDGAMALTAYVLWALTGMVALPGLEILRGDAVVHYVMVAIALPFLAVYATNRRRGWALIPAYVMLAISATVALTGEWRLGEHLVPAFVLSSIGLPFAVVYLRDRRQWWALIPAYVMLAIAGIITIGGSRAQPLTASYVMFAIAFPFAVVFLTDVKRWWALIPAGVMTLVGLHVLPGEPFSGLLDLARLLQRLQGVGLLTAGLWLLLHGLRRQASANTVE